MDGLEIMSCENGFIIFEGTSRGPNVGYSCRKWVAKDNVELGKLVTDLTAKTDASLEIPPTKEKKL